MFLAMLMLAAGAFAQTPTSKNGSASPRLLTPQNSTLVLIDHQPQMAFAAQSMDTQLLINNVTGLATATLSAIDDGYEVYIVTDASAGVTKEAHEMAIQRMVQAGAMPVTWLQVMLEWQRDWARQET
jgi:nicotinamidase-related amidase